MKLTRNKNLRWWIGGLLLAILVGGIATFAYFKMDPLWKGVTIETRIDRQTNSNIIWVHGNAKDATYISLNGREIYIDKKGNFSEAVDLIPGLSVITLKARDRFGKVTEKKFNLVTE